jgi:hypothetical protein
MESNKVAINMVVYPMKDIIGEYSYQDMENIRSTIKNKMMGFIFDCIDDTMNVETAHRDFIIMGNIRLEDL